MTLTLEQLKKIYVHAPEARLLKWLPFLNETLEEFEINTPQRIRMFLAQIGHESAELHYVRELASGEAYEGRADLGNTEPGDGVRYKGRGILQVTGRKNYTSCGQALGLPLVENPALLEEPRNAARSAGWFWKTNNLNALCDLGLFKKLTKKINGGLNGYPHRYQLYQLAFNVIK